MLIINDEYAIKNDGLCYAICKKPKFNPDKPDVVREYTAKWYLNTLSQAVDFLLDRTVAIPEDLKTMSEGIELFKREIRKSIAGLSVDAQ